MKGGRETASEKIRLDYKKAEEIRFIVAQCENAYGVQAALARLLGLRPAAIYQIVHGLRHTAPRAPYGSRRKPATRPKVKDEDVNPIRIMNALGLYTRAEIADEFGYSEDMVANIIKGKTGKHIPWGEVKSDGDHSPKDEGVQE